MVCSSSTCCSSRSSGGRDIRNQLGEGELDELQTVEDPRAIWAWWVSKAPVTGRPRGGLPGRLPARVGEAPDRQPAPGIGQTDARDAYVIAEAARTMPRTLRRVDIGQDVLAELGVLIGFDDARRKKPPGSATAGLLTQAHPALERILSRRRPRRWCWSC
jgi:hypothetical protein